MISFKQKICISNAQSLKRIKAIIPSTTQRACKPAASSRVSNLPNRCNSDVAERGCEEKPSSSGYVAQAAACLVAVGSLVASSAGATPMPVATVAEIDAETAKLAENILRPLFTVYTLLYIVRIPLTWYPDINLKSFPWVIFTTPTEPFLNVTRKIIGSVGGVDVSPIVWVAMISFFNEIMLGPQGSAIFRVFYLSFSAKGLCEMLTAQMLMNQP
ncbi:hypothetical protein CEUSTIGMA_g6731.t1 [Chlamydomonas eustigma]|uniref:Uncharacterized protein n=1 Tax=Chlamydomonas eustigma TaxID=1157962 RepID=A0A250X943_9CHLO|nr:hypothetical protein CEUSTIGMA_g6731.t1 [Chlamydomonas eustigma]|eukprot:GAX79290.1 hypothetical protein CEUSTIGMA_g6731.t1 [Chlamydomonas eustigma]